MRMLRKTKGPTFLIRSVVHVPSPLTMKTGRFISRSAGAVLLQIDSRVDHYNRALIACRNNTHKNIHKKNDSTIKGKSNIRFPYAT